jgi:hypothetical protein
MTVWTDPKQRIAACYIGLQNCQSGKGAQHRQVRVKDLP